MLVPRTLCFFFFNDTATTEIYTLSLHDALPISTMTPVAPSSTVRKPITVARMPAFGSLAFARADCTTSDRKSTRLNSSHANISYAVFCLKKKKNIHHQNL